MSEHTATILLVDDEPQNLKVLHECLWRAGLRTLVSQDGEAALQSVEHLKPDLILLDILLPGIDGYETCCRLKANEATADIPILFMTALTDLEEKLKGFDAGAVDYISKPFQAREVVARVNTHLALQRLRREREAQNAALQQEIVRHQQTENALRASEAQKQAILDGITTNLAFVNENLEILWANKTAAESVNAAPGEMLGRHCYEFWGNPAKPCEHCPTVKAFHTRQTEHTIIETPDGRVWDEKGEPVFNTEGELIGVIEIARDITERKHAEEQIKATLQEKEALLREIHHRVKNNLMVVTSLIQMQAEQTRNAEALALFRDVHNRVMAMSMVHEDLYQSKNLAHIEFATYLERLVNNIRQGFSKTSAIVTVNADDIFLNIYYAIPCGLIVAELVTNAFKYAFPTSDTSGIQPASALSPGSDHLETKSTQPEICIDMRCDNSTCILSISDNGVGLPPEFDLHQADTLGMTLVHSWVTHQLKGTLTVDRLEGTRWTITFQHSL